MLDDDERRARRIRTLADRRAELDQLIAITTDRLGATPFSSKARGVLERDLDDYRVELRAVQAEYDRFTDQRWNLHRNNH